MRETIFDWIGADINIYVRERKSLSTMCKYEIKQSEAKWRRDGEWAVTRGSVTSTQAEPKLAHVKCLDNLITPGLIYLIMKLIDSFRIIVPL